jgi:taurine dioxygenase
MKNTIRVRRIASALGAEVRGVELGSLCLESVQEIKSLLLEHHVLFFPEQGLNNEEHIAFGEHFGELEGHPHLENAKDEQRLFVLTASRGGVADEWHSDLSFLPRPALISILQILKCPEVGGDTLWANLGRAFEELSPPIRDLCEGLSALHNAEPHGHPETMFVHPVVRVHPETGQKVLFVNEHFTRRIVELSVEESELLLGYLARWVAKPRFTVRYRWSPGTVAMWDNRCTQHFVSNDFDGERVIQRVTVMGDEIEEGNRRWAPYQSPVGPSDTDRHDQILQDFLRKGKNPKGE